MSSIDLRKLLRHSIVANSNLPIRVEAPAAPPALLAPPAPGKPRDAPVPRNDTRPSPPRASPVRPHRALRPRRRS